MIRAMSYLTDLCVIGKQVSDTACLARRIGDVRLFRLEKLPVPIPRNPRPNDLAILPRQEPLDKQQIHRV